MGISLFGPDRGNADDGFDLCNGTIVTGKETMFKLALVQSLNIPSLVIVNTVSQCDDNMEFRYKLVGQATQTTPTSQPPMLELYEQVLYSYNASLRHLGLTNIT